MTTAVVTPEDKDRLTMKCGCIYKSEEVHIEDKSKYKDSRFIIIRWLPLEYCKRHTMNYQKKADKMLHRQEVYSKRKKFLKDRQRRRKNEHRATL